MGILSSLSGTLIKALNGFDQVIDVASLAISATHHVVKVGHREAETFDKNHEVESLHRRETVAKAYAALTPEQLALESKF